MVGVLDKKASLTIPELIEIAQSSTTVFVPSSTLDRLTLCVGKRVEASLDEINDLRGIMNLGYTSQQSMDGMLSPISEPDGRFGNYSTVWEFFATAVTGVRIPNDGYSDRNGERVTKQIPHVIFRPLTKDIITLSERALPQLIGCEAYFLERASLRKMNTPNDGSPFLSERLSEPPIPAQPDWVRYLSVARKETEGYRTILSSVQEALARPKQTLDGALQLA